MGFISQLIRCISRIIQMLLKYFNGTAIFRFLVLPTAGVFFDFFTLNLNYSESGKLSFGSHFKVLP